MDEISWIATSRDYPGCRFVTVAMDRVEFRRGVREGTVLRFVAEEDQRGTTSVKYSVRVYADHLDTGAEEPIFATHVWFVCIDAAGAKTPRPPQGHMP